MKRSTLLFTMLFCATSFAYEHYSFIADNDITAIPVKNSNEMMIDLTKQTVIAYGPPPEYPNNTEYTQIRKTVYEKLKIAQTKLPKGLKLCVHEGYRKLSLQEHLFRVHFQQVQVAQPKAPYEDIFNETTRLIAPARKLDGSENIAPQFTGAAIAIYLIDEQGNPVDMGIAPKDWLKDKAGSLSQSFSTHISRQAQAYRDIMADALRSVGFVNYPALYWHWSYGDQYWAYQTHHDYAIYGVWQQS